MKLQLFSKMTDKPRGRKVVRASARAMRGGEDYYEAEPNMKLSHAFMVVLVLHIVAVGGIWAFNHLNAGRQSASIVADLSDKLALSAQPKKAEAPPVVQRQPGDADDPLPSLEPLPGSSAPAFRAAELAPAPIMTAAKSAGDPVVETGAASSKPASAVQKTGATASGGTYTVEKGDNPYKIAKKLGVSYQALLEVNSIEDPTKLQIGTVLKVPAKKN
ncbi:MAG: LysM peptidoglycan-binding domain-containing protein [Chthoniobacterales bacterium]